MRLALSAAITLAFFSNGFVDESIEATLYQGESVQDRSNQVAFMTYVLSPDQERKAAVLIDSIRTFAGIYSEAPIYVALGDPEGIPCESLAGAGVILVPLPQDKAALNYLYGVKPLACAEVEKLTSGKFRTLIYLDPESLVLAQPDAMILDGAHKVSIRPVHLVNNIGQAPSEPVDGFWGPIYREAGVDPASVPVVETVVDVKKVRAYYCCIIMSVRPEEGICGEWLRIFRDRLNDTVYQKEACGDFLHRVFLHQATLCGVINAKAKPDEIVIPPLAYTYPLGLSDRIPEEKRVSKLSEIVTAAMEQLWDNDPSWMDKLDPDDAHKAWVRQAYIKYYKVTDNIFRKEGSCNTYLVVTPAGSVVIDPGGAPEPAGPLLSLTQSAPLKTILLTHAHTDHNGGYEVWNLEKTIPVIAQREHAEFIRYHQRLAGFFAARDAVQGNVASINDEAEIAATVLFADEHAFELGGFHFNIYHTPGETPDTSTIWIPELKAAFVGDNYYTSFPNLSPPRGSKPRWALDFVNSLEKILSLEPEMVF
ncbi:MAG TPA: MBL fold metallo-hydrolase, partial [Spirochaetia bacterium]|nr:MBL fold metallo-hydrolase [Spirochaetia bacterium]